MVEKLLLSPAGLLVSGLVVHVCVLRLHDGEGCSGTTTPLPVVGFHQTAAQETPTTQHTLCSVEKKRKVYLFSDHYGSLLRRQPRVVFCCVNHKAALQQA